MTITMIENTIQCIVLTSPWEHPHPMLLWFPCCRFSSVKHIGLQFFILWWPVFTFQVPGDNIYKIFNLYICNCLKLNVFFWKALYLSIMLIQNMDFLGFFFIDVWESLGHFTWSNRYFSHLCLPSLYQLCSLSFHVADRRGIWNPVLFFLEVILVLCFHLPLITIIMAYR